MARGLSPSFFFYLDENGERREPELPRLPPLLRALRSFLTAMKDLLPHSRNGSLPPRLRRLCPITVSRAEAWGLNQDKGRGEVGHREVQEPAPDQLKGVLSLPPLISLGSPGRTLCRTGQGGGRGLLSEISAQEPGRT